MKNLTENSIEKEFKRTAGICLLLGALLSALAMILKAKKTVRNNATARMQRF